MVTGCSRPVARSRAAADATTIDVVRDRRDVQARRLIARYPDYRSATAAMEYLEGEGFPVDAVALVGEGIRSLERAAGRVAWLVAAASGAVAGGLAGVVLGTVFALAGWLVPASVTPTLPAVGLLLGALVGLASALMMHAAVRGRRWFGSGAAVEADRFELLVEEALADEASRLMRRRLPSYPRSLTS